MLEEAFGPGKDIILPIEGQNCHRIFRALDRKLYDKYHDVYYSQDMWVIGEGSENPTTRYAEELIPYQFPQIRDLTLKWTRKHYIWAGMEVGQSIDWWTEENGSEGIDNMPAAEDYASICDLITRELEISWARKTNDIQAMDQHYLTIDARDAFAPDGEYLGLKAAQRCNWYHGDQPFLVVLAPDGDLANRIMAILLERRL